MRFEFEDAALGLRVLSSGDRRTPRSFSAWHEVARAWAWVHREYWLQTNDCGWWSSERANVSLLSNAIFRAGGVSLQEYPEEKLDADATTRRRGRPDLFSVIDGAEFVCEAKQCWPLITKRKNAAWLPAIQVAMSNATTDAKCNVKGEMQRVALTFVGPRVDRELWSDDMLEHMREQPWNTVWDARRLRCLLRFELFPVGLWKRERVLFSLDDCEWNEQVTYPGCILLVGFLP